MKERDNLISNRNTDNILSAILYTNTIQQNLTLANTYKNEINNYKSEREDEKIALEETRSMIKALAEEIKHIEFKKNNVQNIQILQPPTSSPRAIRPRTKLSVVIAFVVGILVMTFVAVFLEYLSKQKSGSVR
jgi:capsular polysaccharide biosynthesis protein